MSGSTRVTVTLPTDVVTEIDRGEKNRSKFVLEAVRREILRRRRESLEISLANPHPESEQLESAGLNEWFLAGNEDDASSLLNLREGVAVQWIPDKGWVKRKP